MLRNTLRRLSGCNPACMIRTDATGTFSDAKHYKFKLHQCEQHEPRDSMYHDGCFADKPVRYATKKKVDKTLLAMVVDDATGKALAQE
eukprot:CAMPEP_0174851620 /NCGR_PEP_ID=MMETSP1114-20130205/23288_1 /TAXON_ID=312471 /ORGANISM="Neobodo designis, Strain CCAP 1951/1" /LENGTH=87 /DNA_ID=CAMNT_0016086167 /DNA_START=61 /DNA_END=324 /DNA_ORIENTATION=-